MEIPNLIFFLFLALVLVCFGVFLLRRHAEYLSLDDECDFEWEHGLDEGVMVIHGGKEVIMTRAQYEDWKTLPKWMKNKILNKSKDSLRPMTPNEAAAKKGLDKNSKDKREKWL